jgi:hypothetical protein
MINAHAKLGCFGLLLAGAAFACSSGEAQRRSGAWDCHAVDVPLGRTLECTSKVESALGTSDGIAPTSGVTLDGPAYYCPLWVESGADCPPVEVYRDRWSFAQAGGGAGTSDGVSGSGAAGGSAGGATSDSTTGSGAKTAGGGGKTAKGGTSDGASGTGSASGSGDYNADEAPSGGSTGSAGGSAQPAPGSGAASGTAAGGAATKDGVNDGFFCTKEAGVRTCRLAPICTPGSHRDQMDCEPDQSSGLGSGAGTPSSGGFPGGTNDGWPGGGQTECFYPTGAPTGSMPAATFQYVLEAIQGVQSLHMRLTFSPSFVDNTYGATAVGWPKGHKFQELVGSDHAELTFFDKAGAEKLHFKMDYISQSASAPSGWASLGVRGGEGRMILGNASSILKAVTSLDRNLNERGYAAYTVDSPPTTPTYAPSPSAPSWDYRVVYEAWIDNAAFGPSGFGKVHLAYVHASPSKAGSNSLAVTPGPCPPGW